MIDLYAYVFGQSPGLSGYAFGHAAWDLSGPAGTSDGTVNIFDLTRVAIHFGQSFLGATDQSRGTVGSLPAWVFENMPEPKQSRKASEHLPFSSLA